jgi:hypothetical protein
MAAGGALMLVATASFGLAGGLRQLLLDNFDGDAPVIGRTAGRVRSA